MNDKKTKKQIIILAVLIVVALLLIGTWSYALWQVTNKQSNNSLIGTTCLDISFSNESGTISIDNAFPMSDTDALNLTPYTFTITNQCNTSVNYIIGLESVADPLKNQNDYLNYDFLKVKLDTKKSKVFSSLSSLDNDTNSDYTIRDTKDISHYTLNPNTSVTHTLRLYLDENTPSTNQDGTYNSDKYFYGKIRIIAGQNITGMP